MNVLSHNRRESRKKLDELKISNAEKFYLSKLKWRIFEYLLNFSELSCKVQNYFIKRFRIKKRKRVFKLLDLAISITKKEDDERSKQISLFNYRRIYHNKIFSMLKEHTEDSKDEKLKLNLIEKLKLKADSLLNY